MKNLRNRIDLKLVSNKKKRLFKMDIKIKLYVTQKKFDNYLVAILESRVALTPGYVGICILDLSNVLMYEFHYNYSKNEYGSN